MEHKVTHFMYVPFTGLGLYGGHRGTRWLRNRIAVFKQFVVASLLQQTSQHFILWISWRHEDRGDPLINGLFVWLSGLFPNRVVFTYYGVCFYDDKFPETEAYDRLADAVHQSLGELHNIMGEADTILMTIQPSDDCYHTDAVRQIQAALANDPKLQAIGFTHGYIMNYATREVAEYNPTTNPPFYTIKFPRKTFIEPLAHLRYTAIKRDVGKYKQGTPIPSHEYVADALHLGLFRERGFLVGTHGENISTHFNHPFKGATVYGEGAGVSMSPSVLQHFGLANVGTFHVKTSLRKWLLRQLPYGWQRWLRYWFGERFYSKVYNFLRS